MKNYLFLLLLTSSLVSFTMHKYYLSVMDLEYNEEAKSVQMITRIFYDDLEDVLNERYEVNLVIDATENQAVIDSYLSKYLSKKITVSINNEPRRIDFVGKEYEDDYVVCYQEIKNVGIIEDIEIANELLMDLFPEQKNMVHTSIYKKDKSFLLTRGNVTAMLKFSQ